MTAIPIRLPRVSEKHDVLETMGAFHEALRDVAAWAPALVDAEGSANPRDARWLRAFLRGPLRWHLADDDEVLAPVLGGSRSRWLEVSLEHARQKRERLEETALAMELLLEPLGAGDTVPGDAWRRATHAFAVAVDVALRYEDDVVLPTSRLFLDALDRKSLARAIAGRDELRPWTAVEVAGDTPELHRIHRTRTLTTGGAVLRSFADCPRLRSVSVDACAGCRHLEAIRLDDDGRGQVSCAVDSKRHGDGISVRDAMSRDVQCVERDVPLLDAMRTLADAGVTGLPVVDDNGRAIGMLSQSDVVAALAARPEGDKCVADVMMHLAFVVHEANDVQSAARLMVNEHIHRLPVVNDVGAVVGLVSAIDLLRVLSGGSARPT